MQKKIARIGNCAGIILNKVMLELVGIKAGEIVEVSCEKGQIVIKKRS